MNVKTCEVLENLLNQIEPKRRRAKIYDSVKKIRQKKSESSRQEDTPFVRGGVRGSRRARQGPAMAKKEMLEDRKNLMMSMENGPARAGRARSSTRLRKRNPTSLVDDAASYQGVKYYLGECRSIEFSACRKSCVPSP